MAVIPSPASAHPSSAFWIDTLVLGYPEVGVQFQRSSVDKDQVCVEWTKSLTDTQRELDCTGKAVKWWLP